jgi:hypothetical protein
MTGQVAGCGFPPADDAVAAWREKCLNPKYSVSGL